MNIRALITIVGGLFAWAIIVIIELSKNRAALQKASNSIEKALTKQKVPRKYLPEIYIAFDDKSRYLKISHAIIDNSMHPLFIVTIISAIDVVYSLINDKIPRSSCVVFYLLYMVFIIVFTFCHELLASKSELSKTWWYATIIGVLWLVVYLFLCALI